MNYDEINFTDQDQLVGIQFKFEVVGDSLKGTYVGKRENQKTKFGTNNIYRIKNNAGIFFFYGSPVLNDLMTMINIGQIIEVKLTGTKPSGKGNDTKLYTVYGRANLLDTEWLEQQKLVSDMGGATTMVESENYGVNTNNMTPEQMFPDSGNKDGEINVNDINFGGEQVAAPAAPDASKVAVTKTPEEKKAIIEKLAHEKLGVPAGQDAMIPVMTFTKIAMTTDNYDDIIKVLESK